MAIHTPIRKEINEYQSKLFFGLSGRQLVFSLTGIITGIGVYFLFDSLIGKELSGYIVIILVAPLFALGFVKIDREPFERYIIKLFRYIGYPKTRIYETEIKHNSAAVKKESLTKKEQRDAAKTKKRSNYGTNKETLVEEYSSKTRQRENKASFAYFKPS